jgi:hypothetical protein
VVDALTTDPHAFVLTTPDIATFAVRRRHGRLHVIWLVRNAIHVQLQGRPVTSAGERLAPPGVSTLRLTAANDVGSRQRVLRVARAHADRDAAPTSHGHADGASDRHADTQSYGDIYTSGHKHADAAPHGDVHTAPPTDVDTRVRHARHHATHRRPHVDAYGRANTASHRDTDTHAWHARHNAPARQRHVDAYRSAGHLLSCTTLTRCA